MTKVYALFLACAAFTPFAATLMNQAALIVA